MAVVDVALITRHQGAGVDGGVMTQRSQVASVGPAARISVKDVVSE